MYHKHEHTLPNCWWKSVTMMFGCDKCEIAHVSALTNTNKRKTYATANEFATACENDWR